MRIAKNIGIFLFVIASLTVIAKGQEQLFDYHKQRYFSDAAEDAVLKSGEKIQPFLLGFDTFVADLYWLRAIQYVGAHALEADVPVLEAYVNTITDLDPQFAYPYHFAGILLPAAGHYDSAETLLQKGERNLPDEWQFSYDLGFLYFYYFEDYERAIAAYERCLEKEGCLPGAKRLIQTLRAKAGKVEIAFEDMVQQLLSGEETGLDPNEQAFLLRKLEEIGKLLILQQTAREHPPQNDITELIGKPIAQTENAQRALSILQELLQQPLVTAQGNVSAELLENPFESNPYVWDVDTQTVRPMQWK